MTGHKYKLHFFIEWGGCWLWVNSDDKRTLDRFGIGPIEEPRKLGISEQLCNELDALDDEWQTSLDWEYPPDSSPWTDKHFNDFYKRLHIAYKRLCEELKDDYDIAYAMYDEWDGGSQ